MKIDRAAFVIRLRATIIESGSYKTVSKISGVPKGTLENMLRGTKPSFDAVASVAHACGVSLDWLAFGDFGMPPPLRTPKILETVPEPVADETAPEAETSFVMTLPADMRDVLLREAFRLAMDETEDAQIGPFIRGFVMAASYLPAGTT